MAEEHQPTEQAKFSFRHMLESLCRKISVNPVIGAFSIIFGIVGTLFGFYTWYGSVRERDLTVYYSPTRTPIVQQGELQNFTVNFAGKQITGDLSSVEIQLWNAGKESIRRQNILKPVTISTQSNQPIYQVSFQTSRDIVGLKTIPADLSAGSVALEWDIMEHNDGAKIQIIYNGNVALPILVDGIVEGQRKISIAESATESSGAKYVVRQAVTFVIAIGSVVFALKVCEIVPIPAFLEKRRKSSIGAKIVILGLSLVALCLFLFLGLILGELLLQTILPIPRPPFGP
jgi:hypothetical protein